MHLLRVGAVACVLVVTTLHAFELDRFFVPKELVLHATALFAGLLVARASRDRVDVFLTLFLLVSAASGLFAQNPWLAMRAFAISASSVVLFWSARRVRDAGLALPLLRGVALAVIAAAVTSLLQTYGLDLVFFSENRAPGGTLGNRNFVAHAAAFGFPLLLLVTVRAGRSLFWYAGGAAAVASLVLTRSRAAWLAFAVVLAVVFCAMLVSPVLRRDRSVWSRLGVLTIFSMAAVAAVLILPNSLRWRSDNPYLESMRRVADYQGGSGRGRLVQYAHSLEMAARHPILGVGAGNWAVIYPKFAGRNDPSMNDSEPGMTFNPWPSSDWIAAVAERGFSAAILLGLALFALAMRGVRKLWNAVDTDEALGAMALLGTIAGALVTGLFDAVLLLAVPAFLVWTTLGALAPVDDTPRRKLIPMIVLLVALGGVVRSTSQLIAMQIYVTRGDRTSLVRAARIDPGNFRLRLRLARGGPRRQRCEHARAARALYPFSSTARALTRGCGE